MAGEDRMMWVKDRRGTGGGEDEARFCRQFCTLPL